MQFSSNAGEQGIVQDARWLTGTNTNSFPIADLTRCTNRWYYKACIEAWKASPDWEFDDTNNTGFAIATATLVNSQADYTLPSSALKVRRVEVLDQGGNWHVVHPFDETEVPYTALTELMETDGLPKYYRIERNSLILYPAPDNGVSVTLSSGLRLYYLREVDEFVTTDTTQEPGLPEPFHRILSLGAAYDFSVAKGLPQAQTFRQEIELLLKDLRDFIAGRHLNFKAKLRPRVERYT